MPGWSIFPYLSYFITVLLKFPPWCLLDVITSNFNLVGWSWQRLCVHRHGMTTSVRAPSNVLSHIHYINSDLRCHFLICGYGIFPSLRLTISYPRNVSAYNLCIYFPFPFPFTFVSTLYRHLFVPFSFVLMLYPVLSPSVSTPDSIFSPPVSMLDSISSRFDLTLTTFPTYGSCEN